MWFLPCPSKVLGIWLVLRPFGGGPGRPLAGTILISAVSHQSAWHLGGQAEGLEEINIHHHHPATEPIFFLA